MFLGEQRIEDELEVLCFGKFSGVSRDQIFLNPAQSLRIIFAFFRDLILNKLYAHFHENQFYFVRMEIWAGEWGVGLQEKTLVFWKIRFNFKTKNVK